MDYDCRARPTVRLILEDLADGWETPHQRRAAAEERWHELHPLAELAHPIIRKASATLGPDTAGAGNLSPISCAASIPLYELRMSQWRAAVWVDPESGVRWVCAAGLAKGGHLDEDDFYQILESRVTAGRADELLPTARDQQLLKREQASRLLTDWEVGIQSGIGRVLAGLMLGVPTRFQVMHPTRGTHMAEVEIELALEDDLQLLTAEMRLVPEHRASNLGWTLRTRVLTSLSPPSEDWDSAGGINSTYVDEGHTESRALEIAAASERGLLLPARPTDVAHYVHKRHLADNLVNGHASRALCGVFFVPCQDPDRFAPCPRCSDILRSLPG